MEPVHPQERSLQQLHEPHLQNENRRQLQMSLMPLIVWLEILRVC
jgi:hypothetical protein